jgi:hypothetical protein
MLTYYRLDSSGADPLEAGVAAVNARFTGARHHDRRSNEGFAKAMSTRHDFCAIERTAPTAGAAASLVLGELLLLISP